MDSWDTEQPVRPWQRHLVLPGLVALGWLAIELTAQPAMGVAIVCLKFGWNDWRTACWLYERERQSRKGEALFSLYSASALWKIGAGALVLCIILGIIQTVVEAHNPPPGGWKETLAAIYRGTMVVMVALGLAALFALHCLWLAWRTGTKLWLNSDLHRASELNSLPNSVASISSRNSANLVLPLIFTVCFLVAALLCYDRWLRKADELPLSFAAAVVFIPAILLGLRRPLFSWALAKSPSECWAELGPVADGFVGQDSDLAGPAMAGSESCPTEPRTTDYGLRTTDHDQ
jgi:hypothetical protein